MYRYFARFNNTDFKIKELPNLEDSSRETKFSSIEIDFRGKTEDLIPIQFQEIKIIQKDDLDNETLIMTCYAESVEYPEFNFEAQPFILTINLLSPYGYASKRTISATINSIPLSTAITTVLQPLLDDGFIIENNQLNNKLVSEIIKGETVEKIMNYLANKFKFVWYIDKEKKITLKQIEDLVGQTPVINITENNKCYLQNIKPNKNIVSYANKLTIKNSILVTGKNNLIEVTSFEVGETYNLKYPISISINTNSRFDGNTTPFLLEMSDAGDYYVAWNGTSFNFVGVGIDGKTAEETIMLIPDADDETKITGFKLTQTVSAFPVNCYSDTALVPYQSVYIDANEISKIKNKTNTSGIIERIVNTNGKYFLINELQDFAINLFSQNNLVTNDLDCSFKGRLNDSDFINTINQLKITKVFSIELPQFNISGNFIITDTSYQADMHTAKLNLKARNYNLNENYLDIYRVDFEQENEINIGDNLVVFYNQDEKVILNKEIYVDGVLVNENQ